MLGLFSPRKENCKHPNTSIPSSSFKKITTSQNREGTTAGLIDLMCLWFNFCWI